MDEVWLYNRYKRLWTNVICNCNKIWMNGEKYFIGLHVILLPNQDPENSVWKPLPYFHRLLLKETAAAPAPSKVFRGFTEFLAYDTLNAGRPIMPFCNICKNASFTLLYWKNCSSRKQFSATEIPSRSSNFLVFQHFQKCVLLL